MFDFFINTSVAQPISKKFNAYEYVNTSVAQPISKKFNAYEYVMFK